MWANETKRKRKETNKKRETQWNKYTREATTPFYQCGVPHSKFSFRNRTEILLLPVCFHLLFYSVSLCYKKKKKTSENNFSRILWWMRAAYFSCGSAGLHTAFYSKSLNIWLRVNKFGGGLWWFDCLACFSKCFVFFSIVSTFGKGIQTQTALHAFSIVNFFGFSISMERHFRWKKIFTILNLIWLVWYQNKCRKYYKLISL